MQDKALEAAARAIENGSAKEWDALPLIHKLVFRSQARACINDFLAQREAEGAAMCPVEPTQEIIAAAEGHRPYREEGGRDEEYDANSAMTWNAMIAARPRGD